MITTIRGTGRTLADFVQAEFAAYVWDGARNRTDPDLGVRPHRTSIGRPSIDSRADAIRAAAVQP